MVDIFQTIANGFTVIIDYIVGLVSAGLGYFTLLLESSTLLASMIGFLPNILQICGQFVIGAAIFKAIFGRQGSS